MSCCNHKDCDCHQNSSFIFGLVFGLIIGAVIAVLIYKNNKEKVFKDLEKKIKDFFSSLKKTETFENISKKKSKPIKKEVVLPSKLIAQNSEAKVSAPKSKPRVFKK